METTKRLEISQVNFTIAEKKEFSLISSGISGSSSSVWNAYDHLRTLIYIKKLHEKKHVSMIDLVNHINPNLSKQILGHFDKVFNCKEFVNMTMFAKSGKLPFSSYTSLGKNCVDLKKDKKKYTYVCKLNRNQVAELDRTVKGSDKVKGYTFNDTVNGYLPKSSASIKTDFQKAIEALKRVNGLIKNGKFTNAQKLELQSLALILNAGLLPSKKAVKKTVRTVAKKAA